MHLSSMIVVGLAGLVGLAGPASCASRGPSMDHEKIEPRLREDLRAAEQRGDATLPLPVLIVLVREDGEGPPDLARREQRLGETASRLAAQLERNGRRPEMKPLPLANAIATELTPAEILTVAEDPSVEQLMSNRLDRVTTRPPS